MAKDNYLSISSLAKSLSKGATKLEKGKLSIEELTVFPTASSSDVPPLGLSFNSGTA